MLSTAEWDLQLWREREVMTEFHAVQRVRCMADWSPSGGEGSDAPFLTRGSSKRESERARER